jgi:putative Mn2+ efflux pump MntP
MLVVTYIPLVIIALAVSLDGCGVGLLYGVSRIRIPMLSLFIISLCSGIMIWCSMIAGQYFVHWFTPELAKSVGAVILVAVGIWAIIQFFLNSPMNADKDQSGNISPWEAALLGAALSLDALGAGIGAAMVGYSPLPTAILIAMSSGIFIMIGLRMGRLAARLRWLRTLSLLPGFMLVTMGIMKLLIA